MSFVNSIKLKPNLVIGHIQYLNVRCVIFLFVLGIGTVFICITKKVYLQTTDLISQLRNITEIYYLFKSGSQALHVVIGANNIGVEKYEIEYFDNFHKN